MVPWELVFAVIPGLILFFYGIENFSREIMTVARGEFGRLLSRVTQNRLSGALLGAGITAVVQSSAATTIIAIGLVSAGTISFLQSLGVIIGTNIGTAVTAQLIAFNMTAFGQWLIPAGFLIGIFGGRFRFLGKPLFYFGLVFFSLNLISVALDPFKNDPEVIALLARFSALPLAILIGFLFTTMVQSSSVTTGLVVILAQQGLLTVDAAIPFLLGANIGSTTTALLVSAGKGLYARRAAVAHFAFNFGGVLLILPFLGPFTDLVGAIGGTEAQMVANAHLLFNLLAAAVFLPLIHRLKQAVEWMVPGDEPEVLLRSRYLESEIPGDTHQAFELVQKELKYALDITRDLFAASMTYLTSGKETDYQVAIRLENLNDYLDGRIEKAIRTISRRPLSENEAEEATYLIRMSNEIERLGDLGQDLGNFVRKPEANGRLIPAALIGRTEKVYAILDLNITGLAIFFPRILPDTVADLRARDIQLQRMIDAEYRDHLDRLAGENEFSDSRYLEILSILEAANAKVRDIRKLAEQYSKKSGPVPPIVPAPIASLPVKEPLSLGDPVPRDDRERVPE
jgi:phosphate:Na+ symporter